TPPTLAKAFSPSRIAPGETTTITFTITNTNASTAITAISFTDTFPSVLTVANPAGLATTCVGGTTVTGASPGSGTIGVTIPSLAGGASCTLSINVTASAEAVAVNTTSVISSSAGAGGAASATLLIARRPVLTKAFSEVSIGAGETVTL